MGWCKSNRINALRIALSTSMRFGHTSKSVLSTGLFARWAIDVEASWACAGWSHWSQIPKGVYIYIHIHTYIYIHIYYIHIYIYICMSIWLSQRQVSVHALYLSRSLGKPCFSAEVLRDVHRKRSCSSWWPPSKWDSRTCNWTQDPYAIPVKCTLIILDTSWYMEYHAQKSTITVLSSCLEIEWDWCGWTSSC